MNNSVDAQNDDNDDDLGEGGMMVRIMKSFAMNSASSPVTTS